MSAVFFRELGIPAPRFNLNIHGGRNGQMTGRMLEVIEHVLVDHLSALLFCPTFAAVAQLGREGISEGEAALKMVTLIGRFLGR